MDGKSFTVESQTDKGLEIAFESESAEAAIEYFTRLIKQQVPAVLQTPIEWEAKSGTR